jgi:DNA-directed RNA polymerase specialized sigma24 family protein
MRMVSFTLQPAIELACTMYMVCCLGNERGVRIAGFDRELFGFQSNVIPAKGTEPGQGADEEGLRRKIADAVEKLPLEQKEVFILRSRSDMPFKEIAKMQKVPINTALARMQYALAALRPLLSEVYDEL